MLRKMGASLRPLVHLPLPKDDPYYAELAHFVSCSEAKKPFLVTPYDGLMAVKISRAAIESLEIGEGCHN